MVLEKTLESPLDSKEIKPGNPKWNQPWIFIGKTEGRRRREQQAIRWLGVLINSMDMSLTKLQEMVKDREAWRAVVHRVAKSWTWLSNWQQVFQDISYCPVRMFFFDSVPQSDCRQITCLVWKCTGQDIYIKNNPWTSSFISNNLEVVTPIITTRKNWTNWKLIFLRSIKKLRLPGLPPYQNLEQQCI